MERFNAIIQFILNYISTIRITDLLDILIVTVIIYYLIKFVRETRAQQIIKAILLILVLWQLSELLNLTVLNFFLRNFMQVGFLAVILLFQPELRKALEKVGKTRIERFKLFTDNEILWKNKIISEICNACVELAKDKCGALIVIERKNLTQDITSDGTEINAEITASLLCSLFYPGSSLHDGAVIVRDSKILSAGVVLPLYQNVHLSKELGTRHRAAVAMSETCDSLVLVVSEETGTISLAHDGNLQRNLKSETLENALKARLIGTSEKKNIRKELINRFLPKKAKETEEDKK